VFTHLVDLHDVRMLEPGDRLGLALKAGQVVPPGVGAGQDHLEGDQASRFHLSRLVDDAHPTAAQFPQDLIAVDTDRSGCRPLGCGRR